MKIDKTKMIGTMPIESVRKFLKKCQDTFTAGFAEDKLGISPEEAVAFFKLLETEGWIELHPDFQHFEPGKWFRTTVKGNALRHAKLLPRISRARADEIVARLKQRCAEVNSNSYYLCSVKKVAAFGSYASDSPDVGDIDLIVWLEPKQKDAGKASELSIERAHAKRANPSHLEELTFDWQETQQFLKARSPYISFSPERDLRIADKLVTLFEAPAAMAASVSPRG